MPQCASVQHMALVYAAHNGTKACNNVQARSTGALRRRASRIGSARP